MSSYSLADLCDLADVTPRTVRYYIAQGLLRAPSGGGSAARYEDGHLYRLRLVRQLQKEHLPLAEIRRRLAALSDAEVQRLAVEPPRVTDSAADYVARVLGARGVHPLGRPGPAGSAVDFSNRLSRQVADSASSYGSPDDATSQALSAVPQSAVPQLEPTRSQWERVVITPDIELHIRRPQGRDQNRRVDRLLETARTIFEEDRS